VSHWTENSGGKLWKRLRFTEDCNARRRRRRRVMVIVMKEEDF
jgi:hypothetical protein